MKKVRKSEKRPYWYHTTEHECVICGHTKVYRERRYDKKPDDYNKRIKYAQEMCSDHTY